MDKEKHTAEQLIVYAKHYLNSKDCTDDEQYRKRCSNFYGRERYFEGFIQEQPQRSAEAPVKYYTNFPPGYLESKKETI
jgi:hypothetical protein